MTHGSNYSNTMCQLLLGIAELEARRRTVWYIEIRHDSDSERSQSRDCRFIDIHEVGWEDVVERSGSGGDVLRTTRLGVGIYRFELVLSKPVTCQLRSFGSKWTHSWVDFTNASNQAFSVSLTTCDRELIRLI
jgi:hypothetical protein